ncbi:hypothetical protein [Synechococcus phage S-B68]|nr:hypothetical protein [Synechococcus phage S-B68]
MKVQFKSPTGEHVSFLPLSNLTCHPTTKQWALYIDASGARKYLTGDEYGAKLNELIDQGYLVV